MITDIDKIVLESVRKYPGISKAGLHECLNGHVRAYLLDRSLNYLEDKGLIRRKIYHTGGRPAHAFFPFYSKGNRLRIKEYSDQLDELIQNFYNKLIKLGYKERYELKESVEALKDQDFDVTILILEKLIKQIEGEV